MVSFGHICHPNFSKKLPTDFELFLDNLLTYGSEYRELNGVKTVFDLRTQRLKSLKAVVEICN